MKLKFILPVLFFTCISYALDPKFDERVHQGYADDNGVKIHYAELGQGPLIVMIHGFPSYWYMWREQMEDLSKNYHVVAIDQRGYNLSDKPKGIKNYDMKYLVEDVATVIRHLGYKKAVLIGHDWGGQTAWNFAMSRPEMTEKLIVLNNPHQNALMREMKNNPEQYKNRAYARNFRKKNAYKKLKAEDLASWVKDPEIRKKFIAALKRSDFEAMLNYYKQNHFRKPFTPIKTKVQVPVLMIHGLKDKTALPSTLNDTWNWIEKDFTLVTIPNAGHHVVEDAPELVTRSIRMWLNR